MPNLLRVDSSACTTATFRDEQRALIRPVADCFVQMWARPLEGTGQVTMRTVDHQRPAPPTADWLRAAFTSPRQRTVAMQRALLESDRLINELVGADVVLIEGYTSATGATAALTNYLELLLRTDRTVIYDKLALGSSYRSRIAGGAPPVVVVTPSADDQSALAVESARFALLNRVLQCFGVLACDQVYEIPAAAVQLPKVADSPRGLLRPHDVTGIVQAMLQPDAPMHGTAARSTNFRSSNRSRRPS